MDEATAPGGERPVETGRGQAVQTATEIAVRLGALMLLAVWCLQIVMPFVGILIWAFVIAIAAAPAYERVAARVGRRGPTTALFVTLGLLTLIVPALLISDTLVSGAQHFAAHMEDGSLRIPPPPDRIADWPLIGARLHATWLLASESLEAALAPLEPQLRAASLWLLSLVQSAGIGLVQFVLSIAIAGVMLQRGPESDRLLRRFGARVAGHQGAELVDLAIATIRSVVQGIVGVAVIQAVLAGAGFAVAGVPGAGLWAMLVLIAAVVQLPVLLVLIPPILIVFSSAGTLETAIFGAWCLGVGLIDNVLKPILFGRGARVPTVMIFVGALGGMLSMGILGLFLGAVVLSLAYEVVRAWLGDETSGVAVPSDG